MADEPEEPAFWHEKLHVYQRSLAFCSRMAESILDSPHHIAAENHLERASESIPENIVSGNSSWSTQARRHYFGIACGSTLECAGCLDIFRVREKLQVDPWRNEKRNLRQIAQMLVGLVRNTENRAEENPPEWQNNSTGDGSIFFEHERLDVYQLALKFARWVGRPVAKCKTNERHLKKLDRLSTSVVLNIAEGNGRFSPSDHRKFIDVAHQSALKSAVVIDLMIGRNRMDHRQAKIAKTMLSRIVKMLLGMRSYLQGETKQ